MEESLKYGQDNFTLPHEVISLPSQGMFYKNKKESIKIGYLTANDENILMSQNASKEGIIFTLLRQKIYEPGFDINEMLDCDVQAVLMFLRNTAFGPEYNFSIVDPRTNKKFDTVILLEEVNYIEPQHKPDEKGLFTFTLPKSGSEVKLRLLNIGDQKELDKITEQYPQGMVAPVVTRKLEKQIVELDGSDDKLQISKFVNQMPIADSKSIKKFISECEPKLDLEKKIIAPSGEEVVVNITFGVEFFRPFF